MSLGSIEREDVFLVIREFDFSYTTMREETLESQLLGGINSESFRGKHHEIRAIFRPASLAKWLQLDFLSNWHDCLLQVVVLQQLQFLAVDHIELLFFDLFEKGV